MNLNSYLNFVKEVIEWNFVANENHFNVSNYIIDKQVGYVDSEIQETLDAIEANDMKEFLDGIADIFVTLSYKMFLLQYNSLEDKSNPIETILSEFEEYYSKYHIHTFFFNEEDCPTPVYKQIIESIRERNKSFITFSSLGDLYNLIRYFENDNGYAFSQVMTAVLDSNWSKFPLLSAVNVEEEKAYIKKNHSLEDVSAVKVSHNNQTRVVFRDLVKGKLGKIRKPSVFEEPSFPLPDVCDLYI